LTEAKPRVNDHARLLGFYIGAVAGGATTQNG
jgi:hypothetical protein